MKYLIVYKSRHGTTRRMAEHMQNALGSYQTTLVDLEKKEIPDVRNFDAIIVGGSIHAGRIQKEVKNFCQQNKEILLQKKLGLFLCYMLKEKGLEEFNTEYDADLRAHATATGLFGGELLLEQMNFLERFMVKIIGRTSQNVSQLDFAALQEFENKLKSH